MNALTRFLFPKVCLYCREIHPDRGLLCEGCLVGLDLIYPRERCRTCFRESLFRKCLGCQKRPSPWYQASSLFEDGSSAEVLLSDPDRFAKEIAAFFIIQYVRMNWPLPDRFYVDKPLWPIVYKIPKFLPLKKASRWKDASGLKVLYLAKYKDAEIPPFLLGARIFFISYSLSLVEDASSDASLKSNRPLE